MVGITVDFNESGKIDDKDFAILRQYIVNFWFALSKQKKRCEKMNSHIFFEITNY